MRRRRASADLGRVLTMVLMGPLVAGSLEAQEEPDSVVPIEPLVVRVLRSAVGTGSPYAVSVASGEELRRATGGAYLEEALRALPGVQIQNRYNLAAGERLAVRGFGARAQFGIRGVRIMVDGIPATLPDGQTALDHLDLSSLDRVEVLRGPGSALYGNAAGGVLHFRSRPPTNRGAAISVGSSGGSQGLRTFAASVSAAAGTGGVRAALSRLSFDGFRRDPVADDGSSYGSATRSILNASGRWPALGGTLTVAANALDMEADNPGALSDELLSEGDRQAYRFNVLQRTREDIRQGQAGVTWNGPFGALDAELSAWAIRRDFEGAIPPSIVGFDRGAGGVRALFTGSHPTGVGELSLGGGVEVELQSDDRQNWDNVRGDRGPLILDQKESVHSTGLFAQGRLELASGVGLLAGLRYDRFRFEAEDRYLLDDSDDSGERVMDALSPSIGVVVETAPRWELFASLTSSFETPTTTELTNRPDGSGGFNPELDPTRALSVEGGVRGRVDGVWAVEATLFRTDLRDELVPFEVPSQPGRSFFRNVGESRHVGWEATVDGRPVEGFSVRLAYTRVRATFEEYVANGEDLSGRRIPGLAPNRLDGRVTLERRGAFLQLRGLAQDAIPVDDGNTAHSPGYFLADLRAGLDAVGTGGFRVEPWIAVANVFDRRYNTAVTVNAFGGRYFEPGPGRTYRLGASVTWDNR